MKRFLCKRIPALGRPALLDDTEAGHAVQVLRLRDGDRVEALDGTGKSVVAILRTSGKARLELDQSTEPRVESQDGIVLPVILELAVIKGDAMEWAIEKAVELGVRSLIPIITERTVVQMDRKGPEVFQERWQRIADQALKQCGRLSRMDIDLPLELEVLESTHKASEEFPRLFCDEQHAHAAKGTYLLTWLESQKQSLKGVRILIGPEGGFSEKERELLFRSKNLHAVGLGPLILRAETAVTFSVSVSGAVFRGLS